LNESGRAFVARPLSFSIHDLAIAFASDWKTKMQIIF